MLQPTTPTKRVHTTHDLMSSTIGVPVECIYIQVCRVDTLLQTSPDKTFRRRRGGLDLSCNGRRGVRQEWSVLKATYNSNKQFPEDAPEAVNKSIMNHEDQSPRGIRVSGEFESLCPPSAGKIHWGVRRVKVKKDDVAKKRSHAKKTIAVVASWPCLASAKCRWDRKRLAHHNVC